MVGVEVGHTGPPADGQMGKGVGEEQRESKGQ